MKPSQRISIIEAVAEALEPHGWARADIVLEQFGATPFEGASGDLVTHIYRSLADESESVLLELAEHFSLPVQRSGGDAGSLIWRPGDLRVFISHLATNKEQAIGLSRSLDGYGITSFVAHEDIHPSLEWQQEIEKALLSMDAMVALVTPGFPESRWTDQEVGFALGRGLLVVPVKLGLDPYGFFGKHQAIQGLGKTVVQLAGEIYDAFATNPLTQARVADSAVEVFAQSGSFRNAEANARRLLRFPRLSRDQLRAVEEACLENMEIWASFGCPDLLAQLYRKHGYFPREVPSDWSLDLGDPAAASTDG